MFRSDMKAPQLLITRVWSVLGVLKAATEASNISRGNFSIWLVNCSNNIGMCKKLRRLRSAASGPSKIWSCQVTQSHD